MWTPSHHNPKTRLSKELRQLAVISVKFSYWTPFNDLLSVSHLKRSNSWMGQLVKPEFSFNQCPIQVGCWPVKWIYYDKISALHLYSPRKGIFFSLCVLKKEHLCTHSNSLLLLLGSVLPVLSWPDAKPQSNCISSDSQVPASQILFFIGVSVSHLFLFYQCSMNHLTCHRLKEKKSRY